MYYYYYYFITIIFFYIFMRSFALISRFQGDFRALDKREYSMIIRDNFG